jgi:hypothetical protein
MASLNYYAPLQKLLFYTIPKSVLQKLIYHRQFCSERVKQRVELQQERPDFVQSVLKYNQEKDEVVTPAELEMNMR